MSNINQNTSFSRDKKCSHLWKISNYSAIIKRPDEKLRSVKFSAADDDLKWYLEHKVYSFQGHISVSCKLLPDSFFDLRKCQCVYVKLLDICIMDPATGVLSSSQDHGYSYFFKYDDDEGTNETGFEFDIDEIKRFIRNDELLIRCHLTYEVFAHVSAITSEYTVLSDLEKCFIDDHFKDVTISVKGKQYRAHKVILASRSSVFDKMLKVDMSESKNNHIDITDMEQETFEEMLYYIYTGKVKNLDEFAFELLPVADKYDLADLRIMSEEVLREKLSTENAAKILILADMHRAEQLKARTILFIEDNYESCEDFNEKWKSLITGHDHLLKDISSAFSNKTVKNALF